MVTLNYINQIRDQIEFDPIPTITEQRDQDLAEFHEIMPSWRGWNQPDSVGYQIFQYNADWKVRQMQKTRDLWFQGTLAFATGNYLDIKAVEYNQVRFMGETDDSLRLRCIRSLSGISAGTLPGVINRLLAIVTESNLDTPPEINDASILEHENGQDATVYFTTKVVRSIADLPNDATVSEVQGWMDLAINDPIGSDLTISKPTVEDYTINLKVQYKPSKTDSATVIDQVRNNLITYVEGQRKLNQPINNAGIYDAAFIPDTTEDILPISGSNLFTITSGSQVNTGVAKPNVIYICNVTSGITVTSEAV